jgi:hypothetical protein
MLGARTLTNGSRILRSLFAANSSYGTVTSALPSWRFAGMAALGLACVGFNTWNSGNARSYTREFTACRLEELEEGVPREFPLGGHGDSKVVLIKIRS